MHQYRFRIHIIQITEDFNTYLTIQVSLNYKTSEENRLNTRLLQGNALLPLLFNIFINDLSANRNNKLAIHADDTAVFAEWTRERTIAKCIERYLKENSMHGRKLRLNESNIHPNTLSNCWRTLNTSILGIDAEIEEQAELTYLLCKKLRYKKHLFNIARRRYAARKFIGPYVNKTTPLSTKIKWQLYKAQVRLILRYATPEWSSMTKQTQETSRNLMPQKNSKNINMATQLSMKAEYQLYKAT